MVSPTDTDVDGSGNTYTIGSKSAGFSPSVLVTKFSSTGQFIWVREFRNLDGEYDARIEVTEDGQVYVAMTHPVSKNYTMVARLSPATGATSWQKYIESDTTYDLRVREDAPRRIVVLTHDRHVTPFKVHAVSLNESGAMMGQHWTIPPANEWQATDLEQTSDGNFVYLVGGNVGNFDPQATRLVFMTANGVLVRQVELGVGRLLATTSAAGGRVYTVGFASASTLVINCRTNTGTAVNSRTDTVFGVIGASLSDALADNSGSLFISGKRDISGTVKAPLCIRYSYPGLTPLWRLNTGVESTELRFEGLEQDPFGLMYASSVSSTEGYRVYGIDMLTGRVVGRVDSPTPAAFTQPFNTLASNGAGTVSHGAPFATATEEGILSQKIQGVNLKTFGLSSVSVIGGTTVQGTVTAYLPLPYARTVTLSSGSSYAVVPPTAVIPAGATTATFSVQTSSAVFGTVVVTLNADDGLSRRAVRITIYQ